MTKLSREAARKIAHEWTDAVYDYDAEHPYTGGDTVDEGEESESRGFDPWWDVRYSEDQPRDDHGRWTSGGEGGSGGNLTAEEALAAAYYVRGGAFGAPGAGQLNGALRGGEHLSSDQLQQVALLDSAIENHQLGEEKILYRAIYGSQAPDYSAFAPGTKFTDPGYVSTSDDPKFISDTVRQEAGGVAPSQVLEIHAPAGATALDINEHLGAESPYPAQNEVLLPRAPEFLVTAQTSSRTVVTLRT